MCMTTSILGACLLTGQVTALDINFDNPMPRTASSYDGKERSIERFYEPEVPNVSAAGYVILDTNTKIDLGFNTGYYSDKYKQDPTFTVGVTQMIELEGTGWDFILSAKTRLGGRTKHKACRDSYNREYYCGNLTAWSDFKAPEHNTPYIMGVKVRYLW